MTRQSGLSPGIPACRFPTCLADLPAATHSKKLLQEVVSARSREQLCPDSSCAKGLLHAGEAAVGSAREHRLGLGRNFCVCFGGLPRNGVIIEEENSQ